MSSVHTAGFRDARRRQIRVEAGTGCRSLFRSAHPLLPGGLAWRPLDKIPGRSIFKPWPGPGGLSAPSRIRGDRCLGLLTQAGARRRAFSHEPSGRPVSVFASPESQHSARSIPAFRFPTPHLGSAFARYGCI